MIIAEFSHMGNKAGMYKGVNEIQIKTNSKPSVQNDNQSEHNIYQKEYKFDTS